jgi:hypothetical protein
MTAEIAVMNKSAVALAADSAVTIGTHPHIKVYNGINKLFALSKLSPVGVMVYGQAEFMGVPWEPKIKLCRRHLGKQTSSANAFAVCRCHCPYPPDPRHEASCADQRLVLY